jgi:hypothetical protein
MKRGLRLLVIETIETSWRDQRKSRNGIDPDTVHSTVIGYQVRMEVSPQRFHE